MKKRRIINMLLLASTVILVSACGNAKSESAKDSKNTKADSEKVFKFGIPQELASIDPAIATDKVSFGAMNQFYEGLYRMNAKNEPEPAGAAELAEKSEDGLEYKIKLRKDAKWSNGDPVVAADYVYAWQRVADPKTGAEYAYFVEPVKNGAAIIKGEKQPNELGIEAIGDDQLKITLDNPVPYFDKLLAFPTFFPLQQKFVEEKGKQFATSTENTLYNGPFTLEEFDGPGSDLEWKYVKNEKYWDKDQVKMKEIGAFVVKESSTGLNLYEDGQLDDVILTGELAQQFRDNEDYVLDKDGRTIYIDLNQKDKNKPFHNANLRKALSYAIDSKAIVDKVLGDGSTVATGIVPTELAVNPETKKDFVKDSKVYKEYDPKKAKEYLDKAKKELNVEKIKFDILTDDNDSTKKIAEFIQGAFRDKLGIEASVTAVTKPIRLERSGKGDYDIVLAGWGADYNDPSSFIDLFETGNAYNRGGYSNPEYDKLVRAAKTTNVNDPKARWQNFLDAEKILLGDDAGIIPIYQVAEGHLRNPQMKGYVSHTAGASYEYKGIKAE